MFEFKAKVHWQVHEYRREAFNEEIEQKASFPRVRGAIAQLGEHRLCKPRVVGSIPTGSTKIQAQKEFKNVRKRRKNNKKPRRYKEVINVLGVYTTVH